MKKLTTLILSAALALVAFAPSSSSAAFSATGLVKASPVGVTKAPAFFTYKTTADSIATVEGSNYFQSAALRAGDLVYVYASDGKKLYTVTAATASTSTIAAVSETASVWVYCRQSAANLGTAGAAGYCVAPITGTVAKFYTVQTTVVDGDNIINLDVDGTNMTGSATLTASGAAAGDVDTATVSANNSVTAGDAIVVETDGGGAAGVIDTYVQIVP